MAQARFVSGDAAILLMRVPQGVSRFTDHLNAARTDQQDIEFSQLNRADAGNCCPAI
jgi:hypothetical protein